MAGAIRASGMAMGALPDAGAESLLEDYVGAGIRAFLLPGSLLQRPERLAALAALARRRASEAGLGRALVALGGGAVPAAAPPPLPGLPGPLGLAAAGERGLARRTGRLLGGLLAVLGVDLVLAPRLDLATDPKAPGGILDLFGEDSLRAGAMAAAYARGMAEGGAAACGLSFPGCGRLVSDGRKGPPLVSYPLERLGGIEALPFARAVKAGLPAVLVARVLAPALEPERLPAARSARVVEGRLRTDLGFKGLVLGGALDEDPEGPGRAATLGALAGCDLSLALSPAAALEAARALDKALASGELPAPRAVVAGRRLEALFSRLPARDAASPADPAAAGAAARALLEGAQAARLGERAARRAATAFRAAPPRGPALRAGQPRAGEAQATTAASTAGGPGYSAPRSRGFPLSAPPRLVLVMLPPEGGPEAAQSTGFLAALGEALPGARVLSLPCDPGPAEAELLAAAAEAAAPGPALALTCDAHRRPGQESLVHLLEESLPEVGVVALGDPYDAAFFPRAAALGAVYGRDASAARAAAGLALGTLEARGRCPVLVLGLEV